MVDLIVIAKYLPLFNVYETSRKPAIFASNPVSFARQKYLEFHVGRDRGALPARRIGAGGAEVGGWAFQEAYAQDGGLEDEHGTPLLDTVLRFSKEFETHEAPWSPRTPGAAG